VILEVIAAPYFATNCWIFAPTKNSECFIVDPGMAAPNLLPAIADRLKAHNLRPIATVLTHGHLDHTFSVTPLCDGYGIPAFIHSADGKTISDPFKILLQDGPINSMMKELGSPTFSNPKELITFEDSFSINLAGFDVTAHHAPGHTAGSATFVVNDEFLISGDVLFAGAIGRTDLPSGSSAAMKTTIRKKILPLSDELIVLPGHGPQTTIGRERKSNPYLQDSFLNSPSVKGE
jgi:glyoxylase-like metal-dependent hydrolase (beta-lactamase superfamily II)